MRIWERAQKLFARNTAVIGPSGAVTYSELAQRSAGLAKWLVRHPILQKQRAVTRNPSIAAFIKPGSEYIVSQWGIWQAGARFVPLCLSHPPGELQYAVENSDSQIVLVEEDQADFVRDALEGTRCKIEILSENIDVAELSENNAVEVTLPLTEDDDALIIYTSGTTSRPKGTISTMNGIESQIKSLVDAWDYSENDYILHALPLHHVHGVVNAMLCVLWSGGKIEFLPRFDSRKVWQRFNESDINLWMAVPTMYSKLIGEYNSMNTKEQKKCREACSRFRLMVSGSMALPEQTLHEWKEITGHTLLERYGMTELGMALSNPLNPMSGRIPGRVGTPLPGVEIKINPESGHDIEGAIECGELCVKGPGVFKEYYKKKEATTKCFDSEGYFETGDIAARFSDGTYKIVGRKSADIIKSGGYKLSALEIERILLDHSNIASCAVVAIPDTEFESTVGVVIVTKDGSLISRDELYEWSRDRMAKYKIPRQVVCLSAIPLNAMGKISKNKLLPLFNSKSPNAYLKQT